MAKQRQARDGGEMKFLKEMSQVDDRILFGALVVIVVWAWWVL